MKIWIEKNKVLVAAIVSALILVLQQFLAGPREEFSWKAVGFAALIAIIGVIANQWKGKGITIFGILGTLAGVFHTIWTTGTFTWNEFILSSILALLTALMSQLAPEPAPPSKPNQ